MKIAQNDPSLAHALATRRLREADERFSRMLKHEGKGRSPTLKEIRRVLADSIVAEQIDRAKGERQRWILVAASPMRDEIGMLGIAQWNSSRNVREIGIVTKHAVARMFQRTVGSADMREVFKRLGPFAAAMTMTLDLNGRTGPRIDLIGHGGALLGQWDDERGCPVFKTWVDGESASDPEVKKFAALNEVTVRYDAQGE